MSLQGVVHDKASSSAKNYSSASEPTARYHIDIPGLPFELQSLRSAGLYVVVCAASAQAHALAQQILRSAEPSSRGAVIHAGAANHEPYNLRTGVPPHDLREFRLKQATPRAFRWLRKDLDRALRPRERTLVFLVAHEAFGEGVLLDDRELRGWQDWLRDNRCTAVFVVQGAREPASLFAQLLVHNDVVAGASYCHAPTSESLVWEVGFWHSERSVSGPSRHDLQMVDGQIETQLETCGTTASAETEDQRIYLERAVLCASAGMVPQDWHLVDDAEALFHQVRTESGATAVFAIERRDDLEELATRLRQLRRERGPELKLIVVETGASMRHADEEYLANSGASWFVPAAIRGQRLLRQLRQLHRATLPAALKTDGLAQRAPLKNTSAASEMLLPAASFFQKMLALCESVSPNDFVGSLVRLEPAAGLTPMQAATQLRLRRNHDAACMFERHLYLFLSDCPRYQVTTALEQLFVLPFRDIFATQEVYGDVPDIQALSQKMVPRAAAASEESRNAGTATSANEESSTPEVWAERTTNFRPKATRLTRTPAKT